jgi:Forkhead domain/FHA domain
VEDVQEKSLEQESNVHVGEATSVSQELSTAAGVDALQRAITAAADSRMESSIAPQDPLGRDAMTGVDSQSSYNLPPSTPFRSRPGEEPSAPPLALHSTPPVSMPLGDPMVMDSPFLETSPITQEPNEAPRIQAFAKLEFDDGQFYMNTYSVILGRDIRAARAAFQREQQERDSREGMRGGQSTSGGDASQAAFRVKRGGSAKMNSSVVSESGGIIGADDPDASRRKRSKRGSKKSKSTTSSSQFISRKNSIVQPIGHTDYQSLARPTSNDGAHPVDPSSLLPSPEECPLIPIHPPATTGTGSHKGISRKHAKIAFNFDTHIFEVEIKGKNGAFVDDQWYAPGDVRPLKSGSFIQIGGVGVRFLLPETVVGQMDEEEQNYDHNKDMNFAFNNGRGSDMSSDTDEGNDDDDEGVESGDGEDEEDEEEDEGDEDQGGEEEEVPETPSPEPLPQPVPVRRGPGRPPKNGISKRERELAEKEAKGKAKAKEKGKKAAPPVTKNKVGRPRKHSRPETPPVKPEKRKYTKRKVVDATGSATKAKKAPKDPKPPKEKKEKRPPKPPRSPSPVFDESKLTAEELQKPQASYVVLIHEALTNSKTGAMSLPQIYRAIERKYPFYKLRVQTTGWQSSVRHNLSQHHAFRKVERDGKGWMWGIVPGVSIEKERKKRLSPPPQALHQALQQQSISRGMPMDRPMMPAPPGLGNGPAGPPIHPVPLNGSSAVGAEYVMAHPSPQAGTPRGPDAIPQPGSNMQGAATVHPGTIPQRQPAQHSYSGKSAGPVFHPMQENRPPAPPTHAPLVPTIRPPSSTTGPTPPQTPQHQNRGLKLNDKTLQAIASFQTALVAKLSANGSKDAEAIVQSAVNRALGISDKSTVPGKEDPQEIAIMKAVSGMLNQINSKSQAPSSSSSAGGSAENRNPPSRPQQQQPAKPAIQQPSPGRTGGATQQQPQGQGGRQGQGQHAVQAQLIQFLSTALSNKGGQKTSPQPGARPPSAGNSSVGGSGGQSQTRTNGAATSRPPFPGLPPARATATTIPINVNNSQAAVSTSKSPQQPGAANVQKQVQTQSPPAVAGIKRPLENGDAVEGQPETKKLAVDSAVAGAESRGV